MRVVSSAEPGTGRPGGETRKMERVGDGARRERVPKAMRAVDRKVRNGEDMFGFWSVVWIWMFSERDLVRLR
jgi:hypothetical protein